MVVTVKYGKLVNKAIQKDPTSIEQKRYGLGFPLGKSLVGGHFHKSTGVELVRNNLRQLLLTEKGERVMLPNFGLNLRRYLFQPLDELTFEKVRDEILGGIANYAKNIEVVKLGVFNGEEISAYGLPGMIVKLSARIKDEENLSFDIQVEIG
tara:strand:- start:314 stop:769 length:456 start_codon:yes stop_codon:yes gene_type:complete